MLEKVGMHYDGLNYFDYYQMEVAEYRIFKNNIDYKKIRLVAVTKEELSVLKNLARFYGYDISEYFGHEAGWEVAADGLYDSGIDFNEYLDDKNASSFLIYYRDEIAGFAIINKQGTDKDVDYNVAQFFILRKFKNKGIGKHVAYECFNRFKGVWEVMVLPGNEGAYRFWRSIIGKYTHDDCKEYKLDVGRGLRNYFRFSSKS